MGKLGSFFSELLLLSLLSKDLVICQCWVQCQMTDVVQTKANICCCALLLCEVKDDHSAYAAADDF